MQRSNNQMTLGELIDELRYLPPSYDIYLSSPHAYRDYYCDVAFKPRCVTVRKAYFEAMSADGETFTGYKGGDFTMTSTTPVWSAFEGCSGHAIIGLKVDDENECIDLVLEEPQDTDELSVW